MFATFLDMQIFLKNIYDSNDTNLFIYFVIIVITFSFIFFVTKKCISMTKQTNCRRAKLGQRPVHEITNPKEVLRELHFASSFTSKQPQLVERCVALVDKFPAACNISVDDEHYTPFLRACFNGCTELMSHMLRNGADLAITTVNGDNAVYLATYSIISGKCDSFAPLRLLLSAGGVSEFQWEVGHFYIISRHEYHHKILYEGMDINAPRKLGYTALHLAAHKGSSKVVRWLLAHGANPALPCRYTPIELALKNGHNKTAALLQVDMGEETQHSCNETHFNYLP